MFEEGTDLIVHFCAHRMFRPSSEPRTLLVTQKLVHGNEVVQSLPALNRILEPPATKNGLGAISVSSS